MEEYGLGRPLILVLKVELSGGNTGVLDVRRGQNLRELAIGFCVEHALDAGKFADPLEKHLSQKMAEQTQQSDGRARYSTCQAISAL